MREEAFPGGHLRQSSVNIGPRPSISKAPGTHTGGFVVS